VKSPAHAAEAAEEAKQAEMWRQSEAKAAEKERDGQRGKDKGGPWATCRPTLMTSRLGS
jgi:hypothetical protein